jgi:hypothetical protein
MTRWLNLQRFPYQGTARAVHVARLVAILFGAVAVAAPYGLARAAFAGWRGVLRGDWPQPGGKVTLRLCWEVLGADSRDLLTFVHLVGPQNRIIAVRRTHPGLGNYPTSSWQPGARFCDDIHLKIDQDAAAPAVDRVEVGLLAQQSLQRLPAYSSAGTLLDSNFVDWIKIAPAAYAVPAIENPRTVQVR